MFRKKSPLDELFLHFSSKVPNLTVFSIIYMIRIRFFGPRELIRRHFRRAQYLAAFGQTEFGRIWPILFDRIWPFFFGWAVAGWVVGGSGGGSSKGWGPQGVGADGVGPEGVGPPGGGPEGVDSRGVGA